MGALGGGLNRSFQCGGQLPKRTGQVVNCLYFDNGVEQDEHNTWYCYKHELIYIISHRGYSQAAWLPCDPFASVVVCLVRCFFFLVGSLMGERMLDMCLKMVYRVLIRAH